MNTSTLEPKKLRHFLKSTFLSHLQLCEVDDVLKEGLPPYCIDMMVIYFLQKQNLLPVIGTMGGLGTAEVF